MGVDEQAFRCYNDGMELVTHSTVADGAVEMDTEVTAFCAGRSKPGQVTLSDEQMSELVERTAHRTAQLMIDAATAMLAGLYPARAVELPQSAATRCQPSAVLELRQS